jgi:uncharacterized membrane protein required for colicin V production
MQTLTCPSRPALAPSPPLPYHPPAAMRANLLDLLVLAYLGYAVWRGRQRGMPRELPRLLSVLLVLATGCGLFRWSERLAAALSQKAGVGSGLTGFAVVVVVTLLLWRLFRYKLRDWAAQRWPDPARQRRLGGLVGLFRGLAWSALLLVILSYFPLGPLRKPLTENSLYARLALRLARPLYAATHGLPPTPSPKPKPAPGEAR